MKARSNAGQAQRTSAIEGVLTPVVNNHMPRFGVLAWSFVGIALAASIIVAALGAISEIVLPMAFSAVLAVMFRPLSGFLVRHKVKPGLAAGIVVVAFLALMIGVVAITVHGIVDQGSQIHADSDAAITTVSDLTDALSIEEASLVAIKDAVIDAAPMITSGVLAGIASVFGTLIGLVSGSILGLLIMYYLLKDGASIRKSVVSQASPRSRHEFDDFIGTACRMLRDYGKGRTVLSVIVALVVGLAAFLMGLPLVVTIVTVNFIGGYIPYIGAFLGGTLAVIVALADGGLTKAVIMLVVVLASNLILENFVEPKVMGNTLNIHPLSVLIVTALGGLLGGIVGLILAVPVYVIASDAVRRLRVG
jgi:predicted PurR-regulated permease PerM